MNDQENSDQIERDPQAPKFMRPQRPVLDEPLEEEEPRVPSKEQSVAKEEVESESPSRDVTVIAQSEFEPPRQAEHVDSEKQPEKADVYSPYFPRGIYEDAKTVEAYYGRGETTRRPRHSPKPKVTEEDVTKRNMSHWLVLIFAFLMILVLLFLTLTEGIPAGFF
ncbi:MAG: hypothetical protein ACOCYU_06180 [Brevefilum sp.]